MYISKKELLEKTGISYGQLYRWKREGLIPEEWFIKKASKTGQETYLPKDKILERIAYIQEQKGNVSLEQLAKRFSVSQNAPEFDKRMVEQIKEIHPDVAGLIADGSYSRNEAAFLVILSWIYKKYRLTRQDMRALLTGCAGHVAAIKDGEHRFYAIRVGGKIFGVIVEEGQPPFYDTRMEILESWQLEELAQQLVLEYIK